MNVSLYQAASALHATERWQETIAQNLTSASVPGFRKQEFTFASVQAGQHIPPAGATPSATRAVLLPTGSVATNFHPGEFRMTGVKTDVAIDGQGFFEIQLPDGSSAFTRDGEFHLNAQGEFVTKNGHAVLGDAGAIQLDLNNRTEISISATGEISQGADLKGRIKLIEFNDPRLLTRLSGAYFAADHPDIDATPSTASTVRQGSLEMGNTSVVAEMAGLMMAMRSFEANQRMAQIHDERLGRTITELGNVTG